MGVAVSSGLAIEAIFCRYRGVVSSKGQIDYDDIRNGVWSGDGGDGSGCCPGAVLVDAAFAVFVFRVL